MKNVKKTSKYAIKKEDFIEFLASFSPEDINNYILQKGKPRKLIEPMIYFKNKS